MPRVPRLRNPELVVIKGALILTLLWYYYIMSIASISKLSI